MKIGIIGIGLIGGSFALALRRGRALGDARLIGIDRDVGALDAAQALGVIDECASFAAVSTCDALMIAVPVRQIPAVLAEILPHLRSETVVTDAGSTKQDVIVAARLAFGGRIAQFVPGHPIAGRERAGVAAADAGLFDGKHVVLTPIPENTAQSVERVRSLWQGCGARVVEMLAETHDAVFAAVSHLPHLLAFALVDELASRPNAKTLFSFAASGFRDFTRIAGSSPEMWRDITLNNRDALLRELDTYEAQLSKLKRALLARDGDALEKLMARARHARDQWMAGELDGFPDEAT
ncbi:MAG: prephenate dehydrogenase/arogenate dehydrogenase family protein [Burkholderiales bacterium]|nr:prephenate dehydrogenase/arogenate dehydrogenase family protein [Burkholderiales bacterium]